MAVIRSLTVNQNQDASSKKRRKTDDDNDESPSWASMCYDMLFLILLRLGVVDFTAFSGVCKSWRTVAQSSRSLFMLTRPPMSIHISTQVSRKKECTLEDSKDRVFKTILPRSTRKDFIGLVCGYVILFGRLTYDFMLVNPITRHELHFPRFPFYITPNTENFRCALVYSQKKASWAFVILTRFTRRVSFCFSSRRASWTHLLSETQLCDLQFYKGKIYVLKSGISLCELALGPKPALIPVNMKNMVRWTLMFPEFETLGGKLFVVGYVSKNQNATIEVDFDQMKWMDLSYALEEYASFGSMFMRDYSKLEFWKPPRELYEKFGYFHRDDVYVYENAYTYCLIGEMWYCPHKCLDVNVLDE